MAAKAFRKKNPFRVKRPDGQIRRSQMISPFGPGSLVDLVSRSVVIGGLEHWSYDSVNETALDDPRLRRSLLPRLKMLDPELDLAESNYFRQAPPCDPLEPEARVGVRALEFPKWAVCQECRRLANARDAFEDKGDHYRHTCRPNKWGHAVPVRFVAACQRGHLAEFPWDAFAHSKGEKCGRPELYLDEGASGDASRIIVRCENCGLRRALSDVPSLKYRCHGHRPWLGGQATRETCDQDLGLLVRTASDAYFAQVVSALRLPEPEPDAITRRLREPDIWKLVGNITRIDQLQTFAEVQPPVRSLIEGESLDDVLAAIERERSNETRTAETPIRSAEYERFTTANDETPGVLPPPNAQFAAFRIPETRADLPRGVRRLVIVPALRETRVQVSFSRFDSVRANLQGEYDFDKQSVTPAVLTLPTGNEKWLPAVEVRGEGVFVELDPAAVSAWEDRPAVQARAEQLLAAFGKESPKAEFLGIRFYLLHSLSHLLLTAISLECGYAASAIRERIYCSPSQSADGEMCGILLSTGTTGSEGTLGGLVEEGRRLRHHLREAWSLGRLCSNDPVCAAHDPTHEADDRNLEGAACHGCLYVAECSCERFNRYLDRALVVPTIGNDPSLAYFETEP